MTGKSCGLMRRTPWGGPLAGPENAMTCRSYGLRQLLVASLLPLLWAAAALGQQRNEDEYYRLIRFPMQERIVLEPGALEFLPDGRLAIATRRGEIYFVDKPLADNPDDVSYKLFASG